jgi:hypothetical protein
MPDGLIWECDVAVPLFAVYKKWGKSSQCTPLNRSCLSECKIVDGKAKFIMSVFDRAYRNEELGETYICPVMEILCTIKEVILLELEGMPVIESVEVLSVKDLKVQKAEKIKCQNENDIPTVRDFFAYMALQGGTQWPSEEYKKQAYEAADAIISAAESSGPIICYNGAKVR